MAMVAVGNGFRLLYYNFTNYIVFRLDIMHCPKDN